VEEIRIVTYNFGDPRFTQEQWHHVVLPAQPSSETVSVGSGISIIQPPVEDSFYNVLMSHRHLTVDLT
jgi:hypothetical protein